MNIAKLPTISGGEHFYACGYLFFQGYMTSLKAYVMAF